MIFASLLLVCFLNELTDLLQYFIYLLLQCGLSVLINDYNNNDDMMMKNAH